MTMKRILASALILSVVSGLGIVGCADKAKEESSTTISGPNGKTTETVTKEVKTTGDGGASPTSTPK